MTSPPLDISDGASQEQAENPTLTSLLQTLSDQAPLGIGILDRHLRYLYVNPHLAQLNGVPVAAHLGRTVADVIPGVAPFVEPILRRILETGEPALGFESYGAAISGGEERQWLAQFYPVRDENGEVTGIVALVLDVTDSHKAKEALRRSERNLARALDVAHMGMWNWDLATGAVSWSTGYQQLLGKETEAFGGTIEAFLAVVHPDDRDGIQSAVARARDEKSEYRHEYRVIRPDGVYWVEAQGGWEYDGQGGAVRMTGITVDVTSRKVLEEALRDQEEQLRLAVEAGETGTWAWDLRTQRVIWSETTERLYGLAPGTFSGTFEAALACMHPDDRTTPESLEAGLKRWRHEPYERELRAVWPDGSIHWIKMRGRMVLDERGEPLLMRGACVDVTERHRTEEALRTGEERLRLALDAAQMGAWEWDLGRKQTVFSENIGHLFGVPGVMTEARWRAHLHPDDLTRVFSELETAVQSEREYSSEYRIVCDDGSVRWIASRGQILRDAAGRPQRLIGVASDITARRQAEAERQAAAETIRRQAYHDALTGLPNRTLFQDRLETALASAERRQGQAAVLFLDLDRFKQVNDTLGHATGDALLQEVAARLATCLRDEDTLARMGGDEFTVLLSEITNPGDAARVAARMLDTLALPVQVSGQELFATGSVGISVFPHDGTDAATLLRHADVAMYRAKDQGRNGYQLFAPAMNTAALEHLLLENSLRRGLEAGEFTLYYQPQVSPAEGRVVGVEALVRWRHPNLGLVPPAKFIALAEETGLIVPLGDWVLREACRQGAHWQAAGRIIDISVNISARQLRRPEFVARVGEILAETGLPSERLTLELTENALVTAGGPAVAALSRLRTMGVSVAVDDFGTGYSSLSYLRDLPLDVLKIDRAFVQHLADAPRDQAVVRAIIEMGHGLGLWVVAEGVETEAQREFLVWMECDCLQGFLFSVPVLPNELADGPLSAFGTFPPSEREKGQ